MIHKYWVMKINYKNKKKPKIWFNFYKKMEIQILFYLFIDFLEKFTGKDRRTDLSKWSFSDKFH